MTANEIDEAIKEIVANIESEHSANVGEIIKGFKNEDAENQDAYRVTPTLVGKIWRKMESIYEDKYIIDTVRSGLGFTTYLVSKNPNFKIKNWYEKHPIRYEWYKGVITGLITLAVGIFLWLLSKQKEDQEYKELKQHVVRATYRIDSLTKALNEQKKSVRRLY
ncbi:MAG TPA: hypothetical protein VMR70_19750 [Flavisolibacter sp.]|nr:hypothetical protein [Flavisolibacter sp.]